MNVETPLVVTIGEVLWDLLPDGRRLGGAPANFAYHAKQQGIEAFVISAVGDDIDGQAVFDEIASRNLSTRYLATVPEYHTGTVGVELADGIPSYIINAPVAWDFIPWSAQLKQLAQQADAVCFGTLAQRKTISGTTIKRFLKHTRSSCLKVFDINLRNDFYSKDIIKSSLELCDMLKISDEELPVVADIFGLTGNDDSIAAELLRLHHLKYLVLTKGKKGSTLYCGTRIIHVPAYDYGPVIDTVGCGDSFTAALTAGLLLELSPETAMFHASKLAGFVCASSGAMPKIPTEMKITK